MRKIQAVGAVSAVMAFGLLSATNASSTLWLVGGNSLTVALATNAHGTLTIHHKGGLAGEFLIRCTGSWHGSVGPGALGSVSEVLGLASSEKNLMSCTYERERLGMCGKTVNELVLVHILNLPWHSLLALMALIEPVTLNDYLSETGKIPGFSLLCSKTNVTVSCEGEDSVKFTENAVNGASFEFPALSKSGCSDGGEGLTLGFIELLGVQVS